MLKRLFIGLLILSALASEGLVNFPGNIYNLYFNSGSEVGMSGAKAIPPDGLSNPVKNYNSLSDNKLNSNAFILTYNSIQKLKTISLEGIIDSPVNYRKFYDSNCFISNPLIQADKEVIYKQSDLSPPTSTI
jgi:hypothetical protein